MIPQRLRRKTRLAICKIVFPLPPERFDIHFRHALVLLQQRRFDPLVKLAEEIFFPYTQCFCIMGAYIFDCVDDEGVFGARGYGGVELGDGGEVAAWEDVAADEVVGFGVGLVSLLW